MRVLGITSSGMAFEGESEYGAHLIWPQPVMTLAKFATSTDEVLVPASTSDTWHCYFREDYFDLVSRIRRGRFYQATGQESNWKAFVPSGITIAATHRAGNELEIIAKNYGAFKLSMQKNSDLYDLVVLGASTTFTVWSIVAIELISTGEELVTLKSRQSMGALPDIYWAKVPTDHRHKVQHCIEKLADDYRRAVAESVIDRAREAATAILSAYLQSKGDVTANGKDLDDLIKKLTASERQHEKRIIACAAEIPQRLHSRGKTSEKEKRDNLRPIREQDAELAVQCVGVMLCDLRWADWK